MGLFEQLKEAKDFLQAKGVEEPQVAIVLGTGLGLLANRVKVSVSVPYSEIPNMVSPTVEGHAGNFLFGTMGGKRVVMFQGRFHFYEGWDFSRITFPVRLASFLGCSIFIVSNAAGGLNPFFKVSDIMVIRDHIGIPSMTGFNPLRGFNDVRLGPRFPDMSEPYDSELIKLAKEVAVESGVELREGVYVWVSGPSLETPAEQRFLRLIGADAVGMSTVPEVIVARHSGMRVLGFSVITNVLKPDTPQKVDFDAILDAAEEAEPRLSKLIEGVLLKI